MRRNALSAVLLWVALLMVAATPGALYAGMWLAGQLNALWLVPAVPAGWLALSLVLAQSAEGGL